MADTQQLTNYAQFNVLTVTGRVFNAKLVKTKDGNEFLSVSLISTLTKNGDEVEFTFTNNNGIKALCAKGFLPTGRELTITGHISTCGETYEKDGETLLMKRPKVHMTGVQILDGGLGATPKKKVAANNVVPVKAKSAQAPVVDETPELEEDGMTQEDRELALADF